MAFAGIHETGDEAGTDIEVGTKLKCDRTVDQSTVLQMIFQPPKQNIAAQLTGIQDTIFGELPRGETDLW